MTNYYSSELPKLTPGAILEDLERTIAPFEAGDVVTFASKGREMTVGHVELHNGSWEVATVWMNTFGEACGGVFPAATLELAA